MVLFISGKSPGRVAQIRLACPKAFLFGSLIFYYGLQEVVSAVHNHRDGEPVSQLSMSDDSSMSGDGDFCQGMPMSMFMDGFHRSLHRHGSSSNNNSTHQQQLPDCLIYFVTGWVLDDRDKFKGAVVYSFLLAILMECLSAVRGAAAHYVRRPLPRFVCLTTIYGLQALLGYLLMFLAMTFSVEILAAAVVGLSVGNLAFFRYHDFQPHRKRRPMGPAQNETGGGGRSETEPLLASASSQN